MLLYLGQRCLFGLLTVIAASIVAFAIVRSLPGDALDLVYGQYGTDPQTVDRIRDDLGLNKPPIEQYFTWIGGVAHGDFGTSLVTEDSVSSDLFSALGRSLELGAMALIFSLLIALPIGVYSAVYHDSWFDQIARGLAMLTLALPLFWLGVLSLIIPAVYLHWVPPVGYTSLTSDPLNNIYGLLLPSALIGIVFTGPIIRFVRSAMLDVLGQEYIMTAHAKGLSHKYVVWKHAFRNALVPVVSLIGIQMTYLLSGIVVIEKIFGIPGIGRYLLDSLERRDYPAVQAVVLVTAALVVVINLIVDVIYSSLDPRIRVR